MESYVADVVAGVGCDVDVVSVVSLGCDDYVGSVAGYTSESERVGVVGPSVSVVVEVSSGEAW